MRRAFSYLSLATLMFAITTALTCWFFSAITAHAHHVTADGADSVYAVWLPFTPQLTTTHALVSWWHETSHMPYVRATTFTHTRRVAPIALIAATKRQTSRAALSPTLPPNTSRDVAHQTTIDHVTLDPTQWHILYQRSGWQGSATVDMRVVGDMMLGRGVALYSNNQHDTYYPFAAVGADGTHPLLDGTLVIGNLESPLSDEWQARSAAMVLPAPPHFAIATDHMPAPLRRAGFDVLSLANNHGQDGGADGLRQTIELLTAIGIAPVGAGHSRQAARQPVYVTRGGTRFTFVAFNDVGTPTDDTWHWQNETDGWSRAWLDDETVHTIARARQRADYVIALVHWGEEYTHNYTTRQATWAHAMLDAGVDIILGTHPHVAQPIEIYPHARNGKTALIAYSLGNFLFDQSFSVPTSTGTVLRIVLDDEGIALVAVALVFIQQGQAIPLALDTPAATEAIVVLQPPQQPPSFPTHAWQWHDSDNTATPVTLPPDTLVPISEAQPCIAADLRGNGKPLWITHTEDGIVQVQDGTHNDAPVVWHNEAPDWHITRIATGDPNDDGRVEVALLLWKNDPDTNTRRTYPFLLGWRGGTYRIVWGGSATPLPLQDIAIADLNNDHRSELVVLEGGNAPGDMAEYISVWHWHGWGFQKEWSSERGQWHSLRLHDVNGDKLKDIVVNTP